MIYWGVIIPPLSMTCRHAVPYEAGHLSCMQSETWPASLALLRNEAAGRALPAKAMRGDLRPPPVWSCLPGAADS